MADLIYIINSSLDGYIADENGDFDWLSHLTRCTPSSTTPAIGRHRALRPSHVRTMRVCDTLPLDDMSEVDASSPRYRRQPTRWSTHRPWTLFGPQTRLVRTFDPEVVESMKSTPTTTSASWPGLAAEAMRAGLVDRYQLLVVPTIVGGGTPALPDGVTVDLALNADASFRQRLVLLDYRLRST